MRRGVRPGFGRGLGRGGGKWDRQDLNLRPSGLEPHALGGLSYYPAGGPPIPGHRGSPRATGKEGGGIFHDLRVSPSKYRAYLTLWAVKAARASPWARPYAESPLAPSHCHFVNPEYRLDKLESRGGTKKKRRVSPGMAPGPRDGPDASIWLVFPPGQSSESLVPVRWLAHIAGPRLAPTPERRPRLLSTIGSSGGVGVGRARRDHGTITSKVA